MIPKLYKISTFDIKLSNKNYNEILDIKFLVYSQILTDLSLFFESFKILSEIFLLFLTGIIL
jgi:hypothetical protein